MLNAQEVKVGTLIHREVEFEHLLIGDRRRIRGQVPVTDCAELCRNGCRLFRTIAGGAVETGLPRQFYMARPQDPEQGVAPDGVITFVYGYDRRSQLTEDPSRPVGEYWTHIAVNRADSNTLFGTFIALAGLQEYAEFRLSVYRYVKSGNVQEATELINKWTAEKKAIFAAAGGFDELKASRRERHQVK